MIDTLTIICGDALGKLRELPDESVQCCVTSPPYWGLRDYGTDNQIGLEKTPEEYVAKMVEVFREVRRVLRKDGTLWLNLGDSYASGGASGEGERMLASGLNGGKGVGPNEKIQGTQRRAPVPTNLKPKDLVGIPWRVAFALQQDGWWLRSDIIWNKANCMPESVTDRPTRSHEYLFLLTKSARYYYDADAIKEPASEADWESRIGRANLNNKLLPTDELNGIRPRVKYTPNGKDKQRGHSRRHQGFNDRWDHMEKSEQCSGMRNKRDVWTIAPANYPEAHFATFPPDLIKPCIMAGTSAKGCCAKCGSPWERITEKGEIVSLGGSSNENRLKARIADSGPMERRRSDGSSASQYSNQLVHRESNTIGWQPTCKCDAEIEPCVCLDPFAGSGTTGATALELGRKAILIELNPKYIELIQQRCNVTLGLALA